MNISLDQNEKRALLEIMYNERTCHGGCAYEEMLWTSDCEECDFPKAVSSIIDKLEN